MIIQQLVMRPHNQAVYKELIKDMLAHGNGLFSFVLRISAGDIVDYVIMDNLPPESFDEPSTNSTDSKT
jgi:hypothetical protein